MESGVIQFRPKSGISRKIGFCGQVYDLHVAFNIGGGIAEIKLDVENTPFKAQRIAAQDIGRHLTQTFRAGASLENLKDVYASGERIYPVTGCAGVMGAANPLDMLMQVLDVLTRRPQNSAFEAPKTGPAAGKTPILAFSRPSGPVRH